MSGPSIRKLYYSTAELCELIDVTSYDLKKWEKQFHKLKPSVSKTGRRLYKHQDLELIQKIRDLSQLGYTCDEINEILNHPENDKMSHEEYTVDNKNLVDEILSELRSILNIIG